MGKNYKTKAKQPVKNTLNRLFNMRVTGLEPARLSA